MNAAERDEFIEKVSLRVAGHLAVTTRYTYECIRHAVRETLNVEMNPGSVTAEEIRDLLYTDTRPGILGEEIVNVGIEKRRQ